MAWIKWLLILRRLIISHSYIWRVREGKRRDQFSVFIPNQFQINISSSLSYRYAMLRRQPFGYIMSYFFLLLFPFIKSFAAQLVCLPFLERRGGMLSIFKQPIKKSIWLLILISLISLTFSFNPFSHIFLWQISCFVFP